MDQGRGLRNVDRFTEKNEFEGLMDQLKKFEAMLKLRQSEPAGMGMDYHLEHGDSFLRLRVYG
ncbi:hypothetical protein VJ786_02485 [Sphingobacterium sp. PU5-4]|uniref:Uncharacterized protein n=1 Tax=Sphingobacterium tenebrionis TaxID=3111775 RepID=A0ABU8I2Q7_9SPHI